MVRLRNVRRLLQMAARRLLLGSALEERAGGHREGKELSQYR